MTTLHLTEAAQSDPFRSKPGTDQRHLHKGDPDDVE
jgi:hypothetical protein